jgi:hypothetical protein
MGCNCVKTFSKDVIILDVSITKNQQISNNNIEIESPAKSDMSKLFANSSEDRSKSLSLTKMRLDYALSPFRVSTGSKI